MCCKQVYPPTEDSFGYANEIVAEGAWGIKGFAGFHGDSKCLAKGFRPDCQVGPILRADLAGTSWQKLETKGQDGRNVSSRNIPTSAGKNKEIEPR